jgi:gamma-glutamyltranspeptidase/glutathione hydrolase
MKRLAWSFVLVLSAALLPSAGAGSAAAQAPPPDPVTRLAGPERVATAVAVSQAHWTSADDVVLASAADFPDALSGGALAADLDAPLLLTAPGALSAATLTEIRRLQPSLVTVLGGTAAVTAAVVDALTAEGVESRRVGGADRYDTARLIAAELGDVTEVALASGEGFADAVAAGALAAAPGRVPTLLTRRDDLPEATQSLLADLDVVHVDLIGGEAVISAAVEETLSDFGVTVERLGGPTRYETGALVAGEALSRFTADTVPVVLATGEDFPDALSAAALAARLGGLLVIVPSTPLAAAAVARLLVLGGPRFDEGWVVGGPAAVSGVDAVAVAISSGPLQRAPAVEATAPTGAAATVEPLATLAALDVLAGGGNAVDATVAAAGVLGVAEPFSSGIGGGGFMVVYSAEDDRVVTFDSREEAPAAYFPEVFLDDAGEPIPFEERVSSGLGVGVPGTVDGWAQALARYGTRPLDELLRPGIEAAAYGFPLDATFVSQVEDNAERFAAFTSTAELYLPLDGQGQAEGAWFRNPDLARTYEAIAAGGSSAFYRGSVAQALVDTVQSPPVSGVAEAEIRPGLMSTGDLAGYQAVVREPVVSEYRDVTVYGMGLPSSGGLTIALALNQLERFDLGDAPREEALHRYLESIGLAWADRNAYMGDPEYVDAPVEGLLSQDYADDRSALIGETSTPTPRLPGDPFAYQDDPSPSGPLPSASAARSGSTTHLTVSDGEGNVVSYTFTIEQTGGSGIVVPGHGFLLNNELTDFDPVPPHPNAPEAGKRPRSSMSPTLVFRDGEPVLALGTPGGATIITTVLQTMLGVLDFGQTLPEAIAAPRVADFNGESSIAEPTFLATPQAAALQDRGHTFTEVPEIGAATGIQFMADGTVLVGAEPSRRGGGSAGALGPSQPSPPPG